MQMLLFLVVFFFFKQKTAYEMRISDWSSDVCSSDLALRLGKNAGAGSSMAFALDRPCNVPLAVAPIVLNVDSIVLNRRAVNRRRMTWGRARATPQKDRKSVV